MKESGIISNMVYMVKIKTTLGRQQRSDSITKRAAAPSKQTDFMFGMHERGSSGYLPCTDAVTASKAKAFLE